MAEDGDSPIPWPRATAGQRWRTPGTTGGVDEAADSLSEYEKKAGSAAAPGVAFPAGLLAAARFWNHD